MKLCITVLARLASCGLVLLQARRWGARQSVYSWGQLLRPGLPRAPAVFLLGASLSLWACSTSASAPQKSAPGGAGQPATEQPEQPAIAQPASVQAAAEAGASPVGI